MQGVNLLNVMYKIHKLQFLLHSFSILPLVSPFCPSQLPLHSSPLLISGVQQISRYDFQVFSRDILTMIQ